MPILWIVMAAPQSGFVPLREYVPGVAKEAHQCFVTVPSCWNVYGTGGVGRAVQEQGKCLALSTGARLWEREVDVVPLRLLKPRPSDVKAIRQLDIPEYAVWKSFSWHSPDHEGLFFDPKQCLTTGGPQEIQDSELRILIEACNESAQHLMWLCLRWLICRGLSHRYPLFWLIRSPSASGKMCTVSRTWNLRTPLMALIPL